MLIKLLSGDLPRSRALTVLLLVVLLGLLLAPFLFAGARPLNTAATICVYIVLVASYDLLLGYTGIVSFAHTMFYGIGAYGIGIALASVEEPTWGIVFAGLGLALLLTIALAFVIGLFALRVRAIFYAMITLPWRPRSRCWPRSCRISPAARTAAPSACPSCCRRASR